MTDLLQKAFAKASELPAEMQDELAQELLDELVWESRWDSALDQSAAQLDRLAGEALKNHADGKTTPQELDEL